MEAKYYTPTIDEFHHGFEYEFKHSDYPESGWIKYSTPEFNMEREDCPFGRQNLSEFRVKCLDVEDIESLGWEVHYEPAPNFFVLTKYKNSGIRYDLQVKENGLVIIWEFNQEFKKGITFFVGRLNNKSELKRLMKQLNILE